MTAPGGPDSGAGTAAVVLAGGRAARLGGADKPGLLVAGRSLLATVAAAAVAAGAGELIIVGPRREDMVLPPECRVPVRWVQEDPPGGGPVPALRRGLSAVTGSEQSGVTPPGGAGPLVLVLAADLPFLGTGPLTALIRATRGGAGAVLVDDEGRPQWLAGCWRLWALRDALGGYEGRSLRGLFEPLRPARLRWPRADGEPPPWLDCDTPDAVRQARTWAAR